MTLFKKKKVIMKIKMNKRAKMQISWPKWENLLKKLFR